MDDKQRMYDAEGEQLKFGWIDGLKEALSKRYWTKEQAIVTVNDRLELRSLVNGA